MKIKQNQQGFTLLELLVVVAVMAVIAGAAMMSMSGQEEHAGQGVAMHTMQTLENATNQFQTINKVLPNDLESLLCAKSTVTTMAGLTSGVTSNPDAPDTNNNTVINTIAEDGDASALAATTVRIFGGLSDAAGVGGGITDSFARKITVVDLPAAAVPTLTNAGITNLKFATYEACDDVAAPTVTVNGEIIGDVALDENPLIQMSFDNAGEVPGAIGFDVALATGAVMPVLLYEDSEDLGRSDNDIIIVLGIGNSSDLVEDGDFLAKAPRDGNVGRDKFAHYGLALKVGAFQANAANTVDLTQTETNPGDLDGIDWLARAELVAVIDADGDYYEEEIAEFAGLEDE